MIAFEGVRKSFGRGRSEKVIVRDLTGVLESGRSYGILGANGSGRSTLLALIAGTIMPDGGRIRRDVRVSWPLGVRGGFQVKMSARDNIRFLARAYGEPAQRVISFVEDFAELGGNLDAPMSSFSAGMRARLAFGVSMAISFDCYLVDEITGVGDRRFQQRCLDAFQERRRYTDVIMVSDSMKTLKSYCDAGAVLAGGRLHIFEDLDEAVRRFGGAMPAPSVDADWSYAGEDE